jgi:diphthamide biosynthesis enzyme Dph1/Dph2-like protein
MMATRKGAVDAAADAAAARSGPWGVIMGTLGRQGSPGVLTRLEAALDGAGLDHFTVLMSEISLPKVRGENRGERAEGARKD